MAHVGEKFGLGLARLRQPRIEHLQFLRRCPLAFIQAVQLPAHLVHSLCQVAKFIPVGHVNSGLKIALCDLG